MDLIWWIVVVVCDVCLTFHGSVLSMYMKESVTCIENESYLRYLSNAICTYVLKHESFNEERW